MYNTKNDEPLVSVIIPTYKRADRLSNTINSVLNQSYSNFEIIVVDDNDSLSEYRKQTEFIMEEYKNNKNVKYIKHVKNMNGCAARNTGLDNCNGEYICFLDDDDIIYKDKVKKQVEFLEKNLQYGAVYCGRKVGKYIHQPKLEGDLSFYMLSGKSLTITIMIMFRSSAIKNIKWNVKLKRNQEAGFLLEFYNKGYLMGCIDKVLCESIMEDRSNALESEKNEKELLFFLDEYKDIIKNLNIKNAKKKIYAYRYVGILMNYLKEKKLKNSIMAYIKGCKISFIKYNLNLFDYTLNRILRRKKDYYKLKDKNYNIF